MMRLGSVIVFWTAGILCLADTALGQQAGRAGGTDGGAYEVKETRLRAAYRSEMNTKFSPDGRHFACVAHSGPGEGWSALLDGQVGQEYDDIYSLTFSPDSKHLGYVAQRKAKWLVVSDEKPDSEYDQILSRALLFSPDGKHLAYACRTGQKWQAVLDGLAQRAHEAIIEKTMVLSPDGKRLAYVARDGQKRHVVVDGRAEAGYDEIAYGFPIFSADSKHVVYKGTNIGKQFVVMDGKPGPKFDAILDGTPLFSPDGKRMVYVGKHLTPVVGRKRSIEEKSMWVMMLDGRAGPESEEIGRPVFSPDSRRLAYVASAPKRGLQVIVDGRPGAVGYDRIVNGAPVFSPDSRHVIYVAREFEKWQVVVDGRAGPLCDVVNGLTISPDGKRVGYVAVKDNRYVVVVVDGRAGPKYGQILGDCVVFSSDGAHFAYIAFKGGKWVVVADNKESPKYEEGLGSIPAFSPDGKRLAYSIRVDPVADRKQSPEIGQVLSTDGRWVLTINQNDRLRMVVDGKPGPEYDAFPSSAPIFSRDSKHVAYGIRKGGKSMVVLDGKAGPEYDQIIKGHLMFGTDGALEYFAARDGLLYSVKHIPARSSSRPTPTGR